MSKFVGTEIKFYLVKESDVESVCQVDPYNGSTYWVDQIERGTAFEDIEHVKKLKGIQGMMSVWFGKTDTFAILKKTVDTIEVVEE